MLVAGVDVSGYIRLLFLSITIAGVLGSIDIPRGEERQHRTRMRSVRTKPNQMAIDGANRYFLWEPLSLELFVLDAKRSL